MVKKQVQGRGSLLLTCHGASISRRKKYSDFIFSGGTVRLTTLSKALMLLLFWILQQSGILRRHRNIHCTRVLQLVIMNNSDAPSFILTSAKRTDLRKAFYPVKPMKAATGRFRKL